MKKSLIIIAAIAMLSFVILSEKNNATVEQREGLYIFMLSKPTAEYNYMGSIDKKVSWSGKPEEMLNTMVKKARKEYPSAQGIIFTSIAMDKADVIQFK